MNSTKEIFKKFLNQTTIKLKHMKRLPPILVPFWYAIFITDRLVRYSYKFILWLLGFWTCKDCGKTYGVFDERYKHFRIVRTIFEDNQYKHVYKKFNICRECKSKLSEEHQQTIIDDNPMGV